MGSPMTPQSRTVTGLGLPNAPSSPIRSQPARGAIAPERDILHGAAFAAAELPEPEEGAAPPGAYTCC